MKSLVASLWPCSWCTTPVAPPPKKKPPLHYEVDVGKLPDGSPLVRTFVQLSCDAETQHWLDAHEHGAGWVADTCASVLRACCSLTTANGVVGRGSMHVLSRSHASALLQFEPHSMEERKLSMLDIGAGDGGVTSIFKTFFHRIYCTEASWPMRWRLSKAGFTVISDEDAGKKTYNLVSCLNVLDRCDKPHTLLRQLREMVDVNEGCVLLAVVLPWCPFVENGTGQARPSERLPMDGARCRDKPAFEAAVRILHDNAIVPAGFKVVAWSRVPYLCEGSGSYAYHVLDDAIFVLQRV